MARCSQGEPRRPAVGRGGWWRGDCRDQRLRRIAGALVGQRAGGNHLEAVNLLANAGDDGRYASRQLSQLLRFKTPAQYDPYPLPELDAIKAVDLASRLVERATQVVSRRPFFISVEATAKPKGIQPPSSEPENPCSEGDGGVTLGACSIPGTLPGGDLSPFPPIFGL